MVLQAQRTWPFYKRVPGWLSVKRFGRRVDGDWAVSCIIFSLFVAVFLPPPPSPPPLLLLSPSSLLTRCDGCLEDCGAHGWVVRLPAMGALYSLGVASWSQWRTLYIPGAYLPCSMMELLTVANLLADTYFGGQSAHVNYLRYCYTYEQFVSDLFSFSIILYIGSSSKFAENIRYWCFTFSS